MNYLKYITGSILLVLMVSCANRSAGPTGGPKDSIPPVVLRSVPLNGAVNYTKKEILVYFDENISLDKVNENFIISPPQKTQPAVRANGRVLSVNIEDDLIDSTTYSLFFGNAIVDLNEKNPLENYQFAFSTGNEIDTLQVSGKLFDAVNLDPVAGIFVGLHASMGDSAVYNDKFVRVTKTDTEGRFTIKNVKAGHYRIYALGDTNRDFSYQTGEAVAFLNDTIVPTVKTTERRDTTWTDSVTIDTVKIARTASYHPDTLVLSLFKENKKRQYLVKAERRSLHSFSMIFNRAQDSLPVLKPLNFDSSARLLLQSNASLDTLNWWIADSLVYAKDTLKLQVDYLKTDSLFNLISQTDTLTLAFRRPPASRTASPPPVLNFTSNVASSFDIYKDILFKFEQPVLKADTSLIRLQQKVDSLIVPLLYSLQKLDSAGLQYSLKYKWKSGESYEIETDSAAFISIYSVHSKAWKNSFKVKAPEDYATLKVKIEPFDSLVVLQLIDAKEVIIREQTANPKGNVFEYLTPGDFFVKLFVDVNQNGVWDTGDVLLRRFPEPVYYYSKKLSLKANWELEESWDYKSTSDRYRKPDELDKLKKEKKAASDKEGTTGTRSTSGGGNSGGFPGSRMNSGGMSGSGMNMGGMSGNSR